MRGSLASFSHDPYRFGIIPAHAGLTHRQEWPPGLRGDHPRACGAHRVAKSGMAVLMGSSPRMRGSRAVITMRAKNHGIIPAHAGLTHRAWAVLAAHWDHPRACGAHCQRTELALRKEGSSPRMRGSPPEISCHAAFCGIIPAHAGLTLGLRRFLCLFGDHPRACGAHTKKSQY